MNITKDNIGDVLCRYKDGKRLMITDVGDKVVKFMSESWSQPYNTNEHTFNGTVDYSLDAKTSFLDNLNYARVMDYAEISALQKVLSGDSEQREDGDYMLIAISKQREAFIDKINQQANERKAFLFNRFQQDYTEFKPDEKINFFGAIVEKPAAGDGYIINGKYCDKATGDRILLKQESEIKKAPSFNDLISSAVQRTATKDSDNKTVNNIDLPDRE